MECAYYFGIPGGRHMECAYTFVPVRLCLSHARGGGVSLASFIPRLFQQVVEYDLAIRS